MADLDWQSNAKDSGLTVAAEIATRSDAQQPDERIIALWLHGRSPHTVRAYAADVATLLRLTGRGLRELTLGDLQFFADSLSGSPTTRARRLKAVKSLLSFAARIGALRFNVGGGLRVPATPNRVAERILTEDQVFAMLAAVKDNPRDHALLRLLYNGGLRVSEVVGIRWRNLMERTLTVLGKGEKSRTVRISSGTWDELMSLKVASQTPDDRVFSMSTANALLRVRLAARRAGLSTRVSPHWLRHSHATHALRRGADVATVRDTLGHSSLSVTNGYVHSRPDKSSGDYLGV